ncbi:MAG: bifunctional diaminohydroxyphosphoribosylaminopyrimidine deaminase/5-amino-6-(5-phosphoribosylamino)uracil reductase RibD [Planctomycetota bacterium]
MAETSNRAELDERLMARALELAARGEGRVEPNPMVGCVIARDGRVIGEGWHERYGGPHAEVNALSAAGDQARGATAYVTLEPCRHTGKTPPCTGALIRAGVARVVAAAGDPFPEVDGGGLAELRDAGIEVTTGVAAEPARRLLAPYLKLLATGRPGVIGKWAMTLDGKIATRTGSSQWISSPESRAIVHRLRARVDAVLVGRRTAIADDPLLTARLEPPAEPERVATRVVLGAPPRESRLIATAAEAPLLIFARDAGEAEQLAWAREAGAEVVATPPPAAAPAATPTHTAMPANAARLDAVLAELGRRRMTNVLVEGGAGVLGAARDAGQLDEAHVFIGPKLVGGQPAPSPLGGEGVDLIADAGQIVAMSIQAVGGDAYLHGRFTSPPARPSTGAPPR